MTRRGLLLPVLAALIGGASLISASSPPASAAPQAQAQAQAQACRQILFVGARGSGEYGPGSDHWPRGRDPKDPDGLGGTVNSAYLRLITDLAGSRSAQIASVPYPAARVTTLLHDPARYFAGIATAVTWTKNYLTGQARSCPNQRIVLAGFSEGAMVMHRVLHELGGTTAGRKILGRLAAAILAGDGDQVPNDTQQRFGTAALNARGVGQAFRTISHTSKAGFSASVGARVFSVCDRHDIVCGWTDTNIAVCITLDRLCPILAGEMVKVHLSYPGSKPLLAAADRAAAEAGGWNAVKAPPPGGVPAGGQADLQAAACPSATRCLAVGSYRRETSELNPSYPLVENYSGRSWAGTVTPLPANTEQPPDAWLTAVTCPSAAKCIAIGEYYDSLGNLQGLIVTGAGTHWSAAEAPAPGDAFESGNGNVGLNAVACGSATSCVIAGGYLDDDVAFTGELLSETSSGWTVAQVPLPADASETCSGSCDKSGAFDVACPNPHACVVDADYYPDGFLGLLLTGYGTHWTEVKEADPVYPAPLGTEFAQIGCTAKAACVTAGANGIAEVVGAGYGQSWKVSVPRAPHTFQDPETTSVACVPDATCTIAGVIAIGERDTSVGFLLTGSGSSWHFTSAPRPADAAPLKDVSLGSSLAGATCPSAGECFAAGAYGAKSGDVRPLLLSGSGSLWVPLEGPLPAAASSSPDTELTNITCASLTTCVATGFYTNGGSSPTFGMLLSLAG